MSPLSLVSEFLEISIPSWPLLVCVHYYLTVITLRNEPGGRDLALHYPIASCTLSIIIAGSGTIISSVMLGQPVLNTVLNERGILSGIVIWFLVHFSPRDIAYRLSHNIYIKLCLNVLEEIRRCRNILVGVVSASVVYPHSYLPLAISGMVKGTGKRWSMKLHQLLTDSTDTKPYELLRLSFCTKASFIIALMYAVLLKNDVLGKHELVLVGSCFLCLVKGYDVIRNVNTDMFQIIQQFFWNWLTIAVQPTDKTKKEN